MNDTGTTNTSLQTPDQINQAIQAIIGQGGVNVPVPQVTPLNISLPSYEGMDAQFKTFLDQAAKDPGIVNYYNSLYQKAAGDMKTAVSYLEADYQTGVRQTTDTLGNTVAQQGLTFQGESNTLEDTLNKRGIAMTDQGGGKTAYAAGGQPATELSNLNDSQKLRQEATVRSSAQSIQNMGLQRQQGMSKAGSDFATNAQTIQGQQNQAITSEASNLFNSKLYQNQANAQNATNQSNNPTTPATGASGQPLAALGQQPQNLNQTQRQDLWSASGKTGVAPVGFAG